MPTPDNENNLAKESDLFNSAWSHGLYEIRIYGAGSCFTYDPPDKSKSGVSDGLYFMLGHKHLVNRYNRNDSKYFLKDSAYLLHSFDIYLHEKVLQCILKYLYCRILYNRVNFGQNLTCVAWVSLDPSLCCPM